MKNAKSFICGMLTMALIIGLVGTATAAVTKQLTASYNGIKISLNGVETTPKDANGNTVEPFIVNGTTYLPVRAIAGMLGLNVGWDSTTQTVKLSTGDSTSKDTLLAESNDVSIYYTGLTKDSVYDAYDINLYIENNSSKDVIVQIDDLSINDYMTTGIISSNIVSGKKINDRILVSQSSLDANNITAMQKAEFVFNIIEASSYDRIATTPTVSITF